MSIVCTSDFLNNNSRCKSNFFLPLELLAINSLILAKEKRTLASRVYENGCPGKKKFVHLIFPVTPIPTISIPVNFWENPMTDTKRLSIFYSCVHVWSLYGVYLTAKKWSQFYTVCWKAAYTTNKWDLRLAKSTGGPKMGWDLNCVRTVCAYDMNWSDVNTLRGRESFR